MSKLDLSLKVFGNLLGIKISSCLGHKTFAYNDADLIEMLTLFDSESRHNTNYE